MFSRDIPDFIQWYLHILLFSYCENITVWKSQTIMTSCFIAHAASTMKETCSKTKENIIYKKNLHCLVWTWIYFTRETRFQYIFRRPKHEWKYIKILSHEKWIPHSAPKNWIFPINEPHYTKKVLNGMN